MLTFLCKQHQVRQAGSLAKPGAVLLHAQKEAARRPAPVSTVVNQYTSCF